MKKAKAKLMFKEALSYCEEHHLDELEWAKGIGEDTFKKLTTKQFLRDYCWVVYASNFKVATVEKLFPELKKSFKDFDIDALSRMKSISKVLVIFNNERKADCFLRGSKAIAQEGFPTFKKRLRKEGISVLESLPGIGPITKFQLGKNIGLVDEAKPDIWLVRAAEACSATNVDELVNYLSEECNLSKNVVDVVLWRHGADNNLGFKKD